MNPKKIYLAPLRGVTDYLYRTLFEKYFGTFDYLLTPFITTLKGKEIPPRHIRDISEKENDRRRCIPQLIGNNAEDFIRLAEHVFTLGYPVVNLNLGCPHPQITRKKRGSGLLPYPDRIDDFLQTVIPKMHCTLSLKVRLGLDDDRDLERLMAVLNRYPLHEIIIHPRTGKQAYAGHADLDRFTAAAVQSIHPVVYNGDIATLEDFYYREKRFPEVAGWMIGRGVARFPFLLKSLREGRTVATDYTLLRRFHDDVFFENSSILFGPSHLLGKMKEFWFYLCHSFPDAEKTLKSLQRCTTVAAYRRNIDSLFARC